MTLSMSMGNFETIQKTIFFPKLQKSEEILDFRKNWNSRFQNFEKIDLIILPNRSNRSNRKKWLNRLDRFIGQQIKISDLRKSKWDTEISCEILPRYWKVFSKNRNNFRKELFSQNWSIISRLYKKQNLDTVASR